MSLSDVVGPIRRRWYVLLIGLLLAVGVGWGTAAVATKEYSARGLIMLLPSKLATGPNGNPLLNMDGLDLPARLLIAYYTSEPAKTELQQFAPKADVVVSMEESTRGPIIAVDVTDVTPEGTMSVLQKVTDSIPENLARIQTEVGTPTAAAIGSMPLVVDTQAQRDLSGVIRLVVASVAAMLALTFFVLFSVDGILLRRRRHADESAQESNDEPATTDGPDKSPGSRNVELESGGYSTSEDEPSIIQSAERGMHRAEPTLLDELDETETSEAKESDSAVSADDSATALDRPEPATKADAVEQANDTMPGRESMPNYHKPNGAQTLSPEDLDGRSTHAVA